LKKIGFLLSGSGSTLENLADKIKELKTPAEIKIVISSREGVYGITRAQNLDIDTRVVEYKNYKNDIDLYSSKITEIFKEYDVDFIVMGGFMSFYKIPPEYKNKVLNVHPALIPSFCGHLMYGDKVHKAAYDAGVKISGCTVHFVDNEYDHGPILAQGVVNIEKNDTFEDIRNKVQAKERELFPLVIDSFVRDKVSKSGNRFFIEH
jgi:formyltetrahydrofolate-dependent phosphoribosylglycinamide formyltransferase